MRPATELTPGEQAFLLQQFFAANWANMVRPFPRYHELLVKRGTDGHRQDWDRVAKEFTVQDWRDLQVWHNLAWFGYGAVARYPRLATLRQKDRGFTEEQKREVLAIQRQVVGDIIPMYRSLAESGRIELTTTPFYHPILPLVIDTESVGGRARILPCPPASKRRRTPRRNFDERSTTITLNSGVRPAACGPPKAPSAPR